MRSDVRRDLSWSAAAFLSLVWPVVSKGCGGGELVPVENATDDDMAAQLDMLAGIDAWQMHSEKGLRGIASRVQEGKAWDTFTIRYARANGQETEYAKRIRALDEVEQGWLYPHLTIQAYVNDEHSELLSCAVVRTCDLFRAAQHAEAEGIPDAREIFDHGHTIYLNRAYDNNEFIVVPWDMLQTNGVKIGIWRLSK